MINGIGKRAHRHLAPWAGLMVWILVSLVTSVAVAEQSPKLLKLRDSDRSASRADHFDLPSPHTISVGGELAAPSHHAKILSEVARRPAPQWPQTATQPINLIPPVLVMRDNRTDDGNQLAWGLAGTGASIFTGALLFHIESMALQSEYEQLAASASARRYREIRNQIDQTRKFVTALYAVGGSMVTSGVVLMATDNHDGGGLTAKLVPHWMHGNPAARLKVSF
ncbi:hypothetical protein FIV42_04175 [Persicimonas caeni]|uniref:Uncharacterized protein n=1 Tax=Persicimonas caeni TaxID=2292766 RepID=A0A4Y6PP25_PERCE|nr:hypothetical protein [Persicimonas caeni]QDG49963.1 hypothetical protein FIV42_04175 [Persicimonas caeni]QED31184.1 hypothetical protein FRD00_04170 [Persicimonas caeni]